MIDIKKLTQEIFRNKKEKGFNTTDPGKDLLYLMAEFGEMMDSYLKKEDNLGEEMADVLIYMFAIAKMVNVDLEQEVLAKIEKNKRREYKIVNCFYLSSSDSIRRYNKDSI